MSETADPLVVTPRLEIAHLSLADAGFIYELLNEPEFMRFIGDKGVRDEDDARRYLEEGPLADYRDHGYGACLVRDRQSGESMGLCGFYQRSNLDCPDLGFAFRQRFWGQGFAVEASAALLDYARITLGMDEVAAIVDLDNDRSLRLIEALEFEPDGEFRLPEEDVPLRLYRLTLAGTASRGRIC